jgi:enoyl-CoA hydratase
MMSQSYTTLTLELEQHIASVQLNRPSKANAIDEAMFTELKDCMAYLDQADEVRAVVLSGEGKHFCSGIDLSVFSKLQPDRAQLKALILDLQAALSAIEQCGKPVLAAVHGACIGGGLDLAVCCDVRYGSDDCFFSIKEIDLAMTADLGSLQRLPHTLPSGLLNELAYTGRKVKAEEAEAIGLTNRQYANKEDLLAGVMTIARSIAEKSPAAIRGTKAVLQHARDHSVAEGLSHVADWNAEHLDLNAILQAIKERA